MLRLLSRPLLQSATHGLKKQVGGIASRAPFSTTLKPMDSTFQHQDTLPRLPIPDLTATLEKYKEQIAPLLSTAEFEETAAYIEAFKGQSGKRLHKLLEELDEQSSTSWVEGFWDTMYLELRDPLPVNVSPFFVISDPPAGYKNPANAQAERAAALIHSLFRFQQQVRRRTLTPDMEGQGAKAKPLCMFQYSRLLGTTRIPKYNRDELHTSIHSKHIVVMRKDRIFRLDVLDEGTLGQEALLSPTQIEERLLKIIDQADAVKDYPNIGTLTTENRNTWGNLYATITAGETINDSSMDDINGALLVVCLDDVNQENANHLGRIFLHSDNRSLNANRWYDKLQLIVLPNGTAGVNMEHSPIDGHTLLRLMNDVHHDSTGIHPIVETPSLAASATLLQKSPKLLEWNIGSDVQAGIETAAKNYQGLIDSTESIALDFKDWGKETIKALKFSPDAFVQMAYQLAYYRQYGKVVSTYESCMMKNYLHGRTETIRSVSQQSVELVRKFDVAKPAESKKLLIAATTAQNETATRCKLGQGTDRHLFVLKNLAVQKMQRLAGFKVPELFNDPSYSKYMSNVLSTSNCSSDSVDLFGFGAVHPKGLGVGYVIKNNNIIFNVTSFQKPDAKEFVKHLQQSLKDLHTISSS